jgi:hypothetical protein
MPARPIQSQDILLGYNIKGRAPKGGGGGDSATCLPATCIDGDIQSL